MVSLPIFVHSFFTMVREHANAEREKEGDSSSTSASSSSCPSTSSLFLCFWGVVSLSPTNHRQLTKWQYGTGLAKPVRRLTQTGTSCLCSPPRMRPCEGIGGQSFHSSGDVCCGWEKHTRHAALLPLLSLQSINLACYFSARPPRFFCSPNAYPQTPHSSLIVTALAELRFPFWCPKQSWRSSQRETGKITEAQRERREEEEERDLMRKGMRRGRGESLLHFAILFEAKNTDWETKKGRRRALLTKVSLSLSFSFSAPLHPCLLVCMRALSSVSCSPPRD